MFLKQTTSTTILRRKDVVAVLTRRSFSSHFVDICLNFFLVACFRASRCLSRSFSSTSRALRKRRSLRMMLISVRRRHGYALVHVEIGLVSRLELPQIPQRLALLGLHDAVLLASFVVLLDGHNELQELDLDTVLALRIVTLENYMHLLLKSTAFFVSANVTLQVGVAILHGLQLIFVGVHKLTTRVILKQNVGRA